MEFAQLLTDLLPQLIRSGGVGGLTTAADERQLLAQFIAAVANLEVRARGSRIFTGQLNGGPPDPSLGLEYDLYISTDALDLFTYSDGEWVFLVNLMPRGGGGTPTPIAYLGTTGQSTTQTMHQKAITDALKKVAVAVTSGVGTVYDTYEAAEGANPDGTPIILLGFHSAISVDKSMIITGGTVDSMTINYRTSGTIKPVIRNVTQTGRWVVCGGYAGSTPEVLLEDCPQGPDAFLEIYGLGGLVGVPTVTVRNTRGVNRHAYYPPINGTPAGGNLRFQERTGHSLVIYEDATLENQLGPVVTGYPATQTRVILRGTTTLTAGGGHPVQEVYVLNTGTPIAYGDFFIDQRAALLAPIPSGLWGHDLVYRVDAVGVGEWAILGSQPPTPTPTGFAAGTATGSAIPLAWTALAGATFTVTRATNVGFTTGLATVYAGTATSTNAAGLTPATMYYFRITATTAGHDPSAYATTSAATVASSVAPYVETWANDVVAAGGELESINRLALSNLYNNLVTEGYWSKIHALYLFIDGPGNATFNFKDVAAFPLTLHGGLTSTAQGLVSDGTGYYDTGFVPATHAAGVDNLAFDVFEDYTAPSSGTGYGVSFGVTDYNGGHQIGLFRGNVVENHANSTAYMSSIDSDAAQQVNFLLNAQTMATLQRSAGGLLTLYQYGRKVTEITSAATALSGQDFGVFGMAKSNFGGANSIMTGTHKHFCIRQSLTDYEVERLTQLLHEYHLATGRTAAADFFFGDSVSHALNQANGWAKRYTTADNKYMANFAVSGQIGQDFRDDGLAAAQVPTYNGAIHDKLFFAHGTNDVNNSESAATYAGVVADLLDLATAQGWPADKLVVIPAFYQRADSNGAPRQAYVTACQAVADARGATLLNLYQAMKDRPSADADLFDSSDGTHPNDVGAQFIADQVFAHLG